MKILLVCSNGASTTVLLQRMQKEVMNQKLDVIVEAKAFWEVKPVITEWDVILLGPQVKHQMKELQSWTEKVIPTDVIPPTLYGLMDAKKILKMAIDLYNK